MRILVTGSEGFIGQHLRRCLVQAGHTVVGLDIAGQPEIKADITLPLSPIPGLDAVVHLAAVAHPRECDIDAARAFNVNVQGMNRVLKLALESGARKLVFASSSHVYDLPPRYSPTDEAHPLRLNNIYTTTKILGERLCHLHFENYGLSYIALRLFNVYGPGQKTGYFIPDMIARASAGEINLQGGNTVKDWVWVGDVAQALLLAMDSPFVGPVNVGTGIETDLATIAETIASAYGVPWSSLPSDTPTRMCADNGRAKRVLGWTPKVTLKEGLDACCLDAAKVAV